MPKKSSSTKNKKTVSKKQDSKSTLMVVIIIVVLLAIGFWFVKYHTSLIDNKTSKAESTFTSAEYESATNAPEESVSTIWSNRGSTTLEACRLHGNGKWYLHLRGKKTTSKSRYVDVYKYQRSYMGQFNAWNGQWVSYEYGTATTGYVSLALNDNVTTSLLKFKSIGIC